MAIQPFYNAQTREQFLRDAKAALEKEYGLRDCTCNRAWASIVPAPPCAVHGRGFKPKAK